MRPWCTHVIGLSVVTLGVLSFGCRDDSAPPGAVEIAVTNSYLECAVTDLCGQETHVLCLAPPGMCPGHFDLSPAQVTRLKQCRMLLLFEFQQQIEQTLIRLRENGLETRVVSTPPALCVPDTYLVACRQVCHVLSEAYPGRAAQFERRLSAIQERLRLLGGELRTSVLQSGATAAKVLVSHRQAGFAQWLGLETVATFVGSDMETVANIDHCLRKAAGRDVRFVIANRQEGTSLARALADRLQAKAVVFSNFPQRTPGAEGFDRLVRGNVRGLVEAATP